MLGVFCVEADWELSWVKVRMGVLLRAGSVAMAGILDDASCAREMRRRLKPVEAISRVRNAMEGSMVVEYGVSSNLSL